MMHVSCVVSIVCCVVMVDVDSLHFVVQLVGTAMGKISSRMGFVPRGVQEALQCVREIKVVVMLVHVITICEIYT